MGKRATKNTLKGLGKFMPLPVTVAKAAAQILSGAEYKVFVALCGQSQPWNNGTAMLVRSVIKEWRLGSTRTVTAAKRKLLVAELIRCTRQATQHKAALYGVKHLPLDLDAMARAGVRATTWEALDHEPSATNSESARARSHGNRYCDHIGLAEGTKQAPPRPQVKRSAGLSTGSARPQWSQSKNLPGTTAEKTGSADSMESLPLCADAVPK